MSVHLIETIHLAMTLYWSGYDIFFMKVYSRNIKYIDRPQWQLIFLLKRFNLKNHGIIFSLTVFLVQILLGLLDSGYIILCNHIYPNYNIIKSYIELLNSPSMTNQFGSKRTNRLLLVWTCYRMHDNKLPKKNIWENQKTELRDDRKVNLLGSIMNDVDVSGTWNGCMDACKMIAS